MKTMPSLLLLTVLSFASSISLAQDTTGSCQLANHPLASLMDQNFSASETVGHVGHTFWWDYRASLRSQSNEYIYDANFMIAVTTPNGDKKYYLNLCTSEVTKVFTTVTASGVPEVSRFTNGAEGYPQALDDMKQMTHAMILMNETNAPLAKVMDYLDSLKNAAH